MVMGIEFMLSDGDSLIVPLPKVSANLNFYDDWNNWFILKYVILISFALFVNFWIWFIVIIDPFIL